MTEPGRNMIHLNIGMAFRELGFGCVFAPDEGVEIQGIVLYTGFPET